MGLSLRFVFLALVFFQGTLVQAQELTKIAVMPLTPKRVSAETVSILDELLLAALDKQKRYKVMGISDIESMLGMEKLKDALGCDDVACAAEIGGALGIGHLLAGSVSKLGNLVIVNLKLIDTHIPEVVSRGQAKVKADESLYLDANEAAVRDLFAEQPLPAVAATKEPEKKAEQKKAVPKAKVVAPAKPVAEPALAGEKASEPKPVPEVVAEGTLAQKMAAEEDTLADGASAVAAFKKEQAAKKVLEVKVEEKILSARQKQIRRIVLWSMVGLTLGATGGWIYYESEANRLHKKIRTLSSSADNADKVLGRAQSADDRMYYSSVGTGLSALTTLGLWWVWEF